MLDPRTPRARRETNEPHETHERFLPYPLKLYASFERLQGGVLRVIQGALLLCQALTMRLVPTGHWWSPVAMMPLYLGYYAVRRPIWERLYRPYGHVETETNLHIARSQMVLGLVLTANALLSGWRQGVGIAPAVSWPVGLAWAAVLWLATMLAGRLPVDLGHTYSNVHLLVFYALKPGPLPAPDLKWVMLVVWVVAAILVGLGVFEHTWFRRALRKHAGAGAGTDAGPAPPAHESSHGA